MKSFRSFENFLSRCGGDGVASLTSPSDFELSYKWKFGAIREFGAIRAIWGLSYKWIFGAIREFGAIRAIWVLSYKWQRFENSTISQAIRQFKRFDNNDFRSLADSSFSVFWHVLSDSSDSRLFGWENQKVCIIKIMVAWSVFSDSRIC